MILLIFFAEKSSARRLRKSGKAMELMHGRFVFIAMTILLIVIAEKSSERIALTSLI